MAKKDMPYDPSERPDPNFVAPTPDLKIPDVIGVVEGWRAWRVPTEPPRFGTAPKLFSYTNDYFWKPRKYSMAECENCGERVPGESHTCGFYSAKSYERLMQMHYARYDAEKDGMYAVVGKVANWGKVIEATQGWRAQKSYPVLLLVPFEAFRLARPLKEAYGVPVKLHNFLKPARAEM